MPGDDTKLMLPRCLALVLCDSVIQDNATQKHNMLGTFSAITCKSFPAKARVGIYFVVTACRAKYNMEVRIVKVSQDDGDDEPLVGQGFELSCESPLEEIPIGMTFTGHVQSEGVHYVQLLAEGVVIAERRLTILGVKEV